MEQEDKISVSAMVNSLPQQLVSEIYSQKRTVYPFSSVTIVLFVPIIIPA